MRVDSALAEQMQAGGQYLNVHTGHRSWATVVATESAHTFICHRCNQPFTPDEAQTAHHYAGHCLTSPVK